MKKDIANRTDIERLVDLFYEKVKSDETIGYFFTDVVKVNWTQHLPIMYDFWENAVFYSGSYNGNPMLQHTAIHSISPFTMKHFQQWNQLFNDSVDELFEGDKASLIKQRAQSIATVMQIKIFR